MRDDRPSETALKVALTMVTLQEKPGWKDKLPPQLAELSERLILAANAFGYSPSLMRISKRRWMVGFYNVADRIMPGMFEGLGERKIFMNNEVERAINDGFIQVLVLGAGFDTLCLRLAPRFPEVSFFEIDHPSTARAKKKGVEEIGQPANLTLIPADLGKTKMVDILGADPAWDKNKQTIIVMEGLLYYLRPEDVLDVFSQALILTGDQSRVAFSHVLNKSRQGWAQPLLQLIGEPWLSSATTEELPNYIGKGWRIIRSEHPQIERHFEAFALAEKG
jgi:methyltransferase (TIGR00027 family)